MPGTTQTKVLQSSQDALARRMANRQHHLDRASIAKTQKTFIMGGALIEHGKMVGSNICISINNYKVLTKV